MLKQALAVFFNTLTSSFKRTKFWQGERFLLREFKHFFWYAIFALVFSFAGAVLGGSTIGLIAIFLQGLTDPQSPSFETGFSLLDNWLMPSGGSANSSVVRITLLLLFVSWLQAIFLYLGQLSFGYTKYKLVARLRKTIFRRLKSLEYGYFVSSSGGKLINTVTAEIQRTEAFLNASSNLIMSFLQALGYIFAMFFISWKISIFTFMLLSLLITLVSKIRVRIRRASYNLPKTNEKVTSNFVEFINGIRTVHTYATLNYEQDRIDRKIVAAENAGIKVESLLSIVRPISQALGSTALVGVVAIAYQFLSTNGEIQAAVLITYMFALFRALPFLYQALGTLSRLSTMRGSLERVTNLIDPKDKPLFRDGNIQFTGLKDKVELLGVDFSYVQDIPILNQIDLTFRKGETTALVGSSGAGKSTIVDLMLRLIEPTGGQILIDGVDLSKFEIESLRKQMAIVSQDTFIFNASVKDNISYGLENVDNKAVLEAARQANALDFILEMPEGLETELGDRGVRLSGGQRQRISIARALIRDPEILVLDEATSALDSVTEQLIQESLEELVKGRTVIMIAHRLSTIFRADKIVVLDSGRVVEQGTYQQLLEKQGQLWEFHQMQFK